jgi:hypothetical protein
VVELVDTPDLGSGIARCGGSSPPLGTKKGDRILRSFFVTSGRDENEVRRSDPRSEEGITRSVSPKDLNRSRFNPIPPGHQKIRPLYAVLFYGQREGRSSER